MKTGAVNSLIVHENGRKKRKQPNIAKTKLFILESKLECNDNIYCEERKMPLKYPSTNSLIFYKLGAIQFINLRALSKPRKQTAFAGKALHNTIKY
jgi:hypothetical protein